MIKNVLAVKVNAVYMRCVMHNMCTTREEHIVVTIIKDYSYYILYISFFGIEYNEEGSSKANKYLQQRKRIQQSTINTKENQIHIYTSNNLLLHTETQ